MRAASASASTTTLRANLRAGQHLIALLEFYDYKRFDLWENYNEMGEPIEQTQLRIIPTDQTPASYYVPLFPIEAHCALADLLGLDYPAIQKEMEKGYKYR